MITLQNKVYVQLRPDLSDLTHLEQLQTSLISDTPFRIVPQDQLHLTVIHFGKLETIVPTLRHITEIPLATILEYINQLVYDFEMIIASYHNASFTLQPQGIERFGSTQRSCVVVYKTTDILTQLHARCLVELKRFFHTIGTPDVDTFMKNDPNFKHALHIIPHVTLAKSYYGPDPHLPLFPINLQIMRIIY